MSITATAAQADFVPRRAIIDIGSNTVRLVIYAGPARAPAVILNEKVSAKLGAGGAETRRLPTAGVQTALTALRRYDRLVAASGVTQLDVVATAAVRDAEDGPQFLDQISAIGLNPRLLSGEEEAETSAMGILAAFPGASGVVADLGGGSLELIDIDGQNCSHGVSLPFGTLRLQALRKEGVEQFNRTVTKALKQADWEAEPGTTLYLVGGSLRAFARHIMSGLNWPISDPHGFGIEALEAVKFADLLAAKAPEQIQKAAGLSGSRLGSLPDAAALLSILITSIKPDRIVFSSWGLREGLLYQALDPAKRALDPFDAGLGAFVSLYGITPEQVQNVADWAAPVAVGKAKPSRERIRRGAIALALAAARIEPNLRASHAVDWALGKRFIGIRPKDRIMLAAAMLANSGKLNAPDSWRTIASPDNLREAQGWGLTMRLSRRFCGNFPAALDLSALLVEGEVLILRVDPSCSALITDSVQRRLKQLADLLALGCAVRIAPTIP